MFPFVYEINFAGSFHLLFFGLIIPGLAINQARKFRDVQKPLPNRLRHFKTTAFTLVFFGMISVVVAQSEWMELFPRAIPPWRAMLAGILMFVVAVVVMRPRWRRAVERRTRVVHLFMPANATERAWWIAVAVLAGISEEITWRGVQAGLAISFTRSVLVAILFCSISFSAGHIIQGWRSAVVILSLRSAFMVWFG